MTRILRLRRWLPCAASILVASAAACAAEPPSAPNAPVIRRMYAPADAMARWPFPNERYLPVDGDEFESLLNRAGQTAANDGPPELASLAELRLTGSYDGRRRLVGAGELTVNRATSRPANVILDPLSLAVVAPRWKKGGRPATLGTDGRGQTVLVAPQADDLTFDWSLPVVESGTSGTASLLLPAVPSVSLELDVPEAFDVVVSEAAVASAAAPSAGVRRWIVRTSGGATTLRFERRRDGPQVAQHGFRQTVLYDFTERGVEVTAEFRLDILSAPLERLNVRLDPQLTLVDVRVADRRADWVRGAPGSSDATAIEFDRPLHGVNRTVLIKALAPLVVGTRLRLPTIQVLGLFWQRGTMTLAVPAPLRMARVDPVGASLSSLVPLTGGRSGETIELQCFGPDSSADLLLTRATAAAEQTGVSLLSLEPGSAVVEHRCQLRIGAGELFTLDADVPSRWIVDSVTSIPPTALDDWSLSEVVERRRRLTVRLSQALTPERPLKLIITAHARQATAGRAVDRTELRLFEFAQAHDDAPLVAVSSGAALRTEVEQADDDRSPTLETLDPLRRELLDDFAAQHLLDLRETAPPWRLHVSRRVPRYDADVRVAATVDAGELRESYHIEVANKEPLPIERVLVRLKPAKATPPQWTLNDDVRGRLQARKLPLDPAAPGAEATETWQITFQRAVTGKVRLRAVRTTPFEQAADVSFAAVVDAAEQRGTAVVKADPGTSLLLRPRAVSSVPPSEADDGRTAVRGAFQFDPIPATTGDAAALTILRASQSPPTPRAVVWNAKTVSQLESDGRVVHRLRLDVRSWGEGDCRLTLPSEARHPRVFVDGEELETPHGGSIRITFPRRRSFTVAASFTLATGAAPLAMRLPWPVVEIDLPILGDERLLLLPPAFDAPTDFALRSIADDDRSNFVRRLFGPLARPEAGAAFRLLGATAGAETSGFGGDETHAAVADVLRLVGAVVREAASAGRSLTWESVWADVVARRDDQTPLRFDVASLVTRGVAPRRPVAIPPLDAQLDDVDRGRALLFESGQRLVFDDGAVVVAAAYFRSSLSGLLRVFPTSDGPGLPSGGAGRSPVDFETWRRQEYSPWADRDVDWSPGEPAAQGSGHAETVASSTEGVWLVRREAPAALAFAVVLASFAVGRRLVRSTRGPLIVLICGAAAAACIAPAWLAVVFTSVLLGLSGAWGVEFVLPQTAQSRTTGLGVAMDAAGGDSRFRRRPAPVVVKSLLLFSALMVDGAAAQPPAPAGGDAPADVFIPVDDKQQPVKGYYLVPERLLRWLKDRTTARSAGTSESAILKRAEYEATLARDANQNRFIATQLKAAFEADVFEAPALISLPLSVSERAVTSALLDGRLADVRRTPQGLGVVAPQTGAVRIEIAFRPEPQSAGGRSGFSVAVPRLHDAQLRLVMPGELTGLTVPEAAEPPTVGDDRRTAAVRLAPTDRLSVQWDDRPTVAGKSLVSEQLMWLKVRPGSTVVDARFRVRPGRSLSELVLTADPRLQWLPKHGDDSPVVDVRSSPVVAEQATVAERLTLVFAKPLVEETVVDVSFLVTGASGTGRVRLPELRPLDESAGRRCFAYSVDSQLDATVESSVGLTPLAVPEFAALWGAGEPGLPQAAFTLPPADFDWILMTRPTAPRVRASAVQTLVCGRRQINVEWEAHTTVERGAVTRYELAAPLDLQVDAVEVIEVDGDDVGQVVRFSRDDRGGIFVFLRSALGGRHKITLRGRLRAPLEGTVPLPVVSIAAQVDDGRALRIVRLPEVRATLENPHDLVVDGAAEEYASPAGRLVAALKASGPAPSGTLRVLPNDGRFSAHCVTTLAADDAVWHYELSVKMQADRGLVDEIHVELPAGVSMPPAVTPTVPYEIVAAAGDAPRLLRLRPRAAVDGPFQFSIRASLAESPSKASVPAAKLRHAESADYYYRLPANVGPTPVRWETAQLAPAVLPEGLAATTTADQFVVLRAVGPKPHALLHVVGTNLGRPFIRLADHRISTSSVNYFGVSTFLLEPAGIKSLVLRVPPHLEILHTTCAGALVSLVPAGDSRWRLTPASDQMPHFIDVVYRRRPGHSSVDAFAVPQPEEIRIERTFWTLAEADAARIEPVGVSLVSSERLQTERAAVYDAAVDDLRSRGDSDAVAPWSDAVARRRVRLSPTPSAAERRSTPTPDADATSRISSIDRPRMADDDAAPPGDVEFEPDRLFAGAVSPYAATTYAISEGGDGELSVRTATPAGRMLHQLLIVALFAVLGCCWYVIAKSDGALRWSQLGGVLAGVVWIMWLRPEIVGWIIVGVALGSRLHPSLRRARERGGIAVRPMSLPR